MSTMLTIFLLINAMLIGAAVAVATRHALAHFRPHRHDAEKHPTNTVKLPPAVKEQLLAEAQVMYKKILDNSAAQLQLDLGRTSAALNKQLDTLGNKIVTDEMERYRASLNELQKDTDAAVAATHDALNQHQDDLKTTMAEHQKTLIEKMTAEVEADKQRLLAQIDTKLADAAASFLIETMQHDVDLGAQTAYLTKMLEEHKDDFKKELTE